MDTLVKSSDRSICMSVPAQPGYLHWKQPGRNRSFYDLDQDELAVLRILLYLFVFLAIVAVVKAIASALGKKECYDINAEEKEQARKEESEVDLGI